jgi:hypothetical protein
MSPIFDPNINLRFLLKIFVVTHLFIRAKVVIRYRFRDEGLALLEFFELLFLEQKLGNSFHLIMVNFKFTRIVYVTIY